MNERKQFLRNSLDEIRETYRRARLRSKTGKTKAILYHVKEIEKRLSGLYDIVCSGDDGVDVVVADVICLKHMYVPLLDFWGKQVG